MKKKDINSTRLLAIPISVAILSTAFVVSLQIIPAEAEHTTDVGGAIKRTKNSPYVAMSTEHPTSGSHVPSVIPNYDNLNQTKISELRISLHDLWLEHIVWTRQYVVAAIADQPDASFAAERLLKNQEDIDNAIKTFYGDQAGNQLTSQLKDHLFIFHHTQTDPLCIKVR
jgi:hypothetical protein